MARFIIAAFVRWALPWHDRHRHNIIAQHRYNIVVHYFVRWRYVNYRGICPVTSWIKSVGCAYMSSTSSKWFSYFLWLFLHGVWCTLISKRNRREDELCINLSCFFKDLKWVLYSCLFLWLCSVRLHNEIMVDWAWLLFRNYWRAKCDQFFLSVYAIWGSWYVRQISSHQVS